VFEGPLKRLAFGTLSFLGILRLAELRARGVSILAYHGVTRRDDPAAGNRRRLHVPLERFRKHVETIRARWRPIALTEYVAGARMGREFEPRTLVVTFDDGYRNFRTNAWPVLRDHGVPVSLFVLTDDAPRLWTDRLEAAIASTRAREMQWQGRVHSLGTADERARATAALVHAIQQGGQDPEPSVRELLTLLGDPEPAPDDDRDRLDWNELRELRKEGVAIGSHADRHEDLRRRRPAELRGALARSLDTLRAELGEAEYALAYPYGAYNPDVRAAAMSAGFTAAFTTDAGLNDPRPDLYALRRNLVGADDDDARLSATITGLRTILRRRAAP
jgi:peptidoglycan/xylan/chitin deacetylase (PgdA/CDA1 family)